jgi:hypothetical protein
MDCLSQHRANVGDTGSEYLGAFVCYRMDSQVDYWDRRVLDVDWHGIVFWIWDLGMPFGAAGRSVGVHLLVELR